MKLLLIGFTKIKYMPYLNIYLRTLNKFNENEIHLLYWDRDENEDIILNDDIILHRFYLNQKDEIPKLLKLKNFYKFRKYAKNIIYKNSFDKIIILSTIPAIIIKDILINKYREKYIFDYRDYTFEKNKLYKKWVNKLVDYSYITFISSKGFFDFLSKNSKIVPIHNINVDKDKLKIKQKTSVIILAYWGLIRHYEVNKNFIEYFANDNRFQINYYGRMEKTALSLEKYCSENHITNVRFYGEYTPDDRYEFFSKTTFIHNYYENDIQTSPTMGNKFYDGIASHIPQICSKGSFMGNEIIKYNLGLVFPDSQLKEKIINFTTDNPNFSSNCELYLSNVIKENELCEKYIQKFIKGEIDNESI